MRNTIRLLNSNGTAATGKTVELYTWQVGSPFYDTKVGDFIEDTNGVYYIELDDHVIGTVLVDSSAVVSLIKSSWAGDEGHISDDGVTTVKILDGAVTAAKTDFAEAW